jgi:hypothetical protein
MPTPLPAMSYYWPTPMAANPVQPVGYYGYYPGYYPTYNPYPAYNPWMMGGYNPYYGYGVNPYYYGQ